jgi:hypothetical protein
MYQTSTKLTMAHRRYAGADLFDEGADTQMTGCNLFGGADEEARNMFDEMPPNGYEVCKSSDCVLCA